METLACPVCGQANSLPVGLAPAQARCASCGEGLGGEPPPRYFIAMGQKVQGPFERAKVLQWIQQGQVRPEMMFCEEDGDWVAGHDCPDLFPHLARAAPRMPAQRRRAVSEPEPMVEVGGSAAPVPRALRHDVEHAHHAHHRPAAPGGVIFAAVLDFLNAGICLWFVILVLQLMDAVSTLTGGAYDKSPFIGLLLVGAVFALGYLVLGFVLLQGSAGGRVAQYILCGASILVALVRLTRVGEGARLVPALSLALAVLVIVLISTPAASEFFSGSGRRGRPRGAPARGTRRRRPRPRRRRRY